MGFSLDTLTFDQSVIDYLEVIRNDAQNIQILAGHHHELAEQAGTQNAALFQKAHEEMNNAVHALFKAQSVLKSALRDEITRLKGQVSVDVERSHYPLGTWRIAVRLSNPPDPERWSLPMPFVFPKLPKRLLLSDRGYVAVVDRSDGSFIGGQFVKGAWYGHLYTHGFVPENENPTSIEEVKTALRETATKLIERFGCIPG